MARRSPGDARLRSDVARRKSQGRKTRAEATPQRDPHSRPTDWRPAVLVVDDNIDARAIYGMYLRAMGCRVYTAPDGLVAIERAMARRPDIIVLDLEMPRVDGWAAAQQLKHIEPTRHIPIVALTAVPGARESARRAGCDAFLAKPCVPELLWCEIRLMLGVEDSGPTSASRADPDPGSDPRA